MAALLQVHVAEITEEPCDMEVIEIDIDLNPDASHKLDHTDSSLVPDRTQVLDEDPEINKSSNAEIRMIDEDGESEGTESSKPDEILDARGEFLPEGGDSGVATETVGDVETVRVPRKKSEWLAAWLIEAAEWEGGRWDPSEWRQLRERLLSAKIRRQLEKLGVLPVVEEPGRNNLKRLTAFGVNKKLGRSLGVKMYNPLFEAGVWV